MELIFAKFIFTAAAVLAGGPGQNIPIMSQVTDPVPEIRQRVAMPTFVPEPCPPVPVGVVAPPCVPVYPPSIGFQIFCTAPGVYTVTVRLGLLAQLSVGGKVWVESARDRALLAAWNAAPGSPAYISGSLQVPSTAEESCYRITVDANGPVEIIAEPGVSFVTVAR